MELEGKVAIVTGGAVRLGRAIALDLAQAGVRIALHYGRSADAAEKTLAAIQRTGGKGVLIPADLLDPTKAARSIVEQTSAAFGGADILINNAAIFESGTLETTTENQWDRHFAINLKAPFFLMQAFAAQLSAGGRAHVINIADWRATWPGTNYTAYTLTKSALVSLTQTAAKQLAPEVQVNAIAPGAILSPPGKDASYLDGLAEHIPLRHPGSPEEITRTIRYLLASDFVTGETIHVAGGQQQ